MHTTGSSPSSHSSSQCCSIKPGPRPRHVSCRASKSKGTAGKSNKQIPNLFWGAVPMQSVRKLPGLVSLPPAGELAVDPTDTRTYR